MSKIKIKKGLIACYLLASIFYLLAGCTVTPKRAVAQEISFDGTHQNSGFIGWHGYGRAVITAHARDRYNGLIAVYGRRFTPPLVADEGLTPYREISPPQDCYEITAQALVNFQIMNGWRKQEPPP